MNSKIDVEIKKLIDEAYDEAKRILIENRDAMDRVANRLLEVETIYGDEFKKLVSKDSSTE